MLNRLISVCILSHVCNLHFFDFMNHSAIITVVINRRKRKHGVELCKEVVLPSHQINQTLNIVENRPGVMPAVSFRKCITPFKRIERSLKLSVRIFPSHHSARRIKQIAVILRTFCIKIQFFLWSVQCFPQLINRKIIVSVFECSRRILIDLHIVRNVA
ncbi:hypothetical protein D3C80_1623340 [compost metagenome]